MVLCLAFAAARSVLAQRPLSDVLSGFDDEAPGFAVDATPAEDGGRWWDVSGSIELSGSGNLLSHRSATGTAYGGVQRLRNRLNVQLDLQFPQRAGGGGAGLRVLRDWQVRLAGWGFYDLAYALNGRATYSRRVRRTYERDADVGEAWLRGSLGDAVDFKLGRQVVIWGRSETLRVLDVLNPLDNLEPGRVDLEDLRLPVGMARLDAYAGNWTFSLLAIPEIRLNRDPVVGSDFFPGSVELPEHRPHDFRDTELAAAVTGIFSGWDVSFHAAWFWNDQARVRRDPVAARLVHDRLWLLGSGGNYVTGSWLWKYELAYVDGVRFFGGDGGRRGRFDALVGVEYYGIRDLTIVVEGLNRHLLDDAQVLRRPPDSTRGDAQELAVRITRNFLRETLYVTALAVFLGWNAGDGSIARFDIEYDLRDALTLGVGALLYQRGDLPPLDSWARNDRLLFSLKWSF